jgi:transposase
MARFFREPDRRQRYLLPVDMLDWLPEDDIVHLLVDAVALMDLAAFEATCKIGKAGQAPFAPRGLLALLLHAYSHGIRSSRAIERRCGREAGFRFIIGAEVPDHTVIARCRRRHAERMKAVFLAVLELGREAGLIRLGLVALDGTKVKAHAALEANRTARRIEAEIARMLAQAGTLDAREDDLLGTRCGDEPPEGLSKAADRRARLLACQEKLARQAAEAAARQQAKIETRAAEERATGRRKRGRKPKPPDLAIDPRADA